MNEYDAAVAGLLRMLPPRAARALRWLLSAQGRWIRIPAGLLCLLCSAFWFLPVIGLEYLPIGLILIARDIRWLQPPVGRLLLRLEGVVHRLRDRFAARRARR